MLRRVSCLLTVLAVALLGADPAPSLLPPPSVMVFPMQGGDRAVDREASARIAVELATHIAAEGSLRVVPAPSGTDPKDYGAAAERAGADYYVSGYAVPLGNGISLVLHAVRVRSGIIVFSTTAQVDTLADAGAQGDVLRAAIGRYALRNLAQYESIPTPAPAASAVPAAPTVGNTVALAAGRTAAVLPVSGSGDAERRAAMTRALAAGLERGGLRVVVLAEGTIPAAACAAAHADGTLSGTLEERTESRVFGAATSATFRLLGYDCTGTPVYDRSSTVRQAGGAPAANTVAERAVDAAIGAYLHPTAKRR